MNFKESYQKMLEGNKVRRKGDNGYFYYDENTKHVYHYISEKCFDRLIENIEIENALAEDWEVVEEREVVEETKGKVWKPSAGELYYYINSKGEIKFSYYNNRSTKDKRRVCNIGNYFKTDEEADHMVEKLKVIKELQDFALENEEIDWRDKYVTRYTTKYFISYDFNEEKILTTGLAFFLQSNIYFASKKIAQEAIKKIGEDRIKKYYFDIED